MNKIDCEKCGGSGYLPHFMHIDGGVCYRCEGTGKVAFVASTDDLNKQICDRIFNLYKVDGTGGVAAHVGVWIWAEGTGKTKAGTGHWAITQIVPGNEDCNSYVDSQYISLAELRECYKGFIQQGFKCLEGAEEIEFISRHLAPHNDHWARIADDWYRQCQ